MLNKLLAGVGTLILAGFLIWLYGNSQKNAGRMSERVEWNRQMGAFEKRAGQILVERVNEVRKIEHVRAETSNKVGYDVQKRIAALSDALRVRASGGSNGNGDGSDLPRLPYAPIDPVGAGQASDMVACGEAVIKAEGWQQWYNEVFQ